jgi:hypothetical protein
MFRTEETFAALNFFAGLVEALAALAALVARTGADFFADCRETSLRDAAARALDLRTAGLRPAFAGRFFLTERLFMEPTIASDLTNEQKI